MSFIGDIFVCQRSATFLVERIVGFEPTTFSLATRHSTTELYPQLAHLAGFEPTCIQLAFS